MLYQCCQDTQCFELLPQNLGLTPDQPKSLELAQPEEEKSVKSPNLWQMSLPELLGFLTSSTLIPKWSIFQGKIKKNLRH